MSLRRRALPLVLALAFSPALRAERHSSPGGVEGALRLLEAWRIEEAALVVASLHESRPDDPEVKFLDGNVKFQLGDYPGALARIEEAIAGAHAAGRGGAVQEWRALGELVRSTEEATRGFVDERSPEGHFIVRHAPGRDALLTRYAFAALEGARREIADHDFGVAAALGEPVRVEIFPEVADLAKVSTLTQKEIETSGTIALCKFNRLMIVSPRALVRGYPWLDTLSHEYTHFVVSRASHNTVPIWLHEGLAKFEERRWRQAPGGGLTPTMEHLLATALTKSKKLITFEEMYPSMAKLPSQADTALAFAEVYTVVEYLYSKKGWEGVRALLERMKDGRGDAGAVAAVMGESFDEFQRGWKAWLRGKKLRLHPGLVPASLKFAHDKPQKKGAKAKEDDDTEEITEERARRFARLAGMLRAQTRLSAAAVEYEKAGALVGPANLPVANKLARTWLELGDPDRAIAAAEPAFELYPDSAGLASTLGQAWQRKGDAHKAITYFEGAVAVNPFDPGPHCGLARLYPASDARAAGEEVACRALAGGEGE